jgi:hypothetical protein
MPGPSEGSTEQETSAPQIAEEREPISVTAEPVAETVAIPDGDEAVTPAKESASRSRRRRTSSRPDATAEVANSPDGEVTRDGEAALAAFPD